MGIRAHATTKYRPPRPKCRHIGGKRTHGLPGQIDRQRGKDHEMNPGKANQIWNRITGRNPSSNLKEISASTAETSLSSSPVNVVSSLVMDLRNLSGRP